MQKANPRVESVQKKKMKIKKATSNYSQRRLVTCNAMFANKWQTQSKNELQRYRICDERQVNIWAATDLEILEITEPNTVREDILHADKIFRRLSPDYFLWIKKRFQSFKWMKERQLIDSETSIIIESLLQEIHFWAEKIFNQQDYDSAEIRLKTFPMISPEDEKPTPFMYPANEKLPIFNPVTDYVLSLVDTIQDEALHLGWTEPGLYQNQGTASFPYGYEWGLVNVINRGDIIENVTSRYIEVISSTGEFNPVLNKKYLRR